MTDVFAVILVKKGCEAGGKGLFASNPAHCLRVGGWREAVICLRGARRAGAAKSPLPRLTSCFLTLSLGQATDSSFSPDPAAG